MCRERQAGVVVALIFFFFFFFFSPHRSRKGDRMNRIVLPMLSLGFLFVSLPLASAAEPNAEQAKAIAEIKKLGGKVTVDEKIPDKPIISVDLTDSMVSDAGLESLKGLAALQSLDLHGTEVTDAGLECLKGFTENRSLNLSDTKVTDAGPKRLKGLTKLQSLKLIDTKVTDAGLEHLKGLTKLQSLTLGTTRVTDAGLEHLKGLTNLQSLGLSGTEVTDAGLEHLKGLTKLQSLDLIGTKVTDAGLEHLKGLTNLQSLDLGHQGDRRRAGKSQGSNHTPTAVPLRHQGHGRWAERPSEGIAEGEDNPLMEIPCVMGWETNRSSPYFCIRQCGNACWSFFTRHP